MTIQISSKTIDLTPALRDYAEEKMGSLEKYIQRFDDEGVAEITLTLARTTMHHRKGDVFEAIADLRLPKKILRATEETTDIRAAIDAVKDKLHVEIEKYKTQHGVA